MKNKGGQLGEQTTVFAFLFLLVIIGIGIAGGIYVFFGSSYDFRYIESDLLNYKIRNCLSENVFDDNFKNNFYEICKIDKKVIEDNEYVIRILVDGKEFLKLGNEVECELSGKSESYPECEDASFNLNGKEIQVLTGSNQQSGSANA